GLQARLDVAASLTDGLRFVAGVQRDVAVGPDLHVGPDGVVVIEDERQQLVVDRDALQRLFGDLTIDGGDRSNGFPRETHRIVERVAALPGDLLDLVVVLLAAGNRSRPPHHVAVLVRDDRLHAGERTRPGHVDASDPRMRMRTAEHARVQHARQLDVAGVDRLAADPFHGVDAWRGTTNDAQRSDRGTRRDTTCRWIHGWRRVLRAWR